MYAPQNRVNFSKSVFLSQAEVSIHIRTELRYNTIKLYVRSNLQGRMNNTVNFEFTFRALWRRRHIVGGGRLQQPEVSHCAGTLQHDQQKSTNFR